MLIAGGKGWLDEAAERELRKFCAPAVAPTLLQARRLIASQRWVGLVIDAELSDGRGVELLPLIRARDTDASILLVASRGWPEASRDALSHRAFFVAHPLPESWPGCVRDCLFPRVAVALEDRLAALGLSKRECEVFSGLVRGGTAKSIARELDVCAGTIQSHRARVYKRLKVSNLRQLITRLLLVA